MYFANWRKNLLNFSLILAGIVFFSSFRGNSAILAQSNPAFIGEVRVMEADQTGIPNPAGLAFSPKANAFHVLERRRRSQPTPADADFVKLAPYAHRMGSARIREAIQDAINVAFDRSFNRLLIVDPQANRLIEVRERPNGNLDPSTRVRHNIQHFGLKNPQGITVDPLNGHLFILDTVGPRILHIEPEPDGTFDQAVISVVDLQPAGLADVRGLAFDPTTGHLHLISLAVQKLYELTQAGQVVTTRDLAQFNLKDPQGMVFAPSGDLTDSPSQISLYVTDGGTPDAPQNQAGANSIAPSGYQLYLPLILRGTDGEEIVLPAPEAIQADLVPPPAGEIVELTFTEAVAPAAATAEGTLIRTILTSQFSPPSPDPSGIAYLPASGTLMIVDGEVDEMPIFAGDSMWQTSLSGSVLDSLPTSFSDEPVGIDVNPINRHLFIGDDTGQRRVYELNPGNDGLYA
ncbi:MAG TPA: SdiA-regulated domain-containing protein, partial [Anaerolineae bacterium]|nr:SdiA-regulated domain-containing protein [Anaerolineae bacterium]